MSQPTDSTRAIYPCLAPLSSTHIHYSFHQRYQMEYVPPTIPVFSPEQAAALAREQFNQIWTKYLADFRSTRQRLVEEMDGIVLLDQHRPARKKELNPTWFREQISQSGPAFPDRKKHLISTDTIDNYFKANVLRKQDWGVYDPESMATLLLCRQLDRTRERNWLPSAIPEGEEWYWVWTQEKPNAPLRPCPYPDLPAWLSPMSLVFTRWAGASWNNVGWIRIGNLGAISFAGVLQEYQRVPSISTFEELPLALTPQQLELWDRTQKAVESVSPAREATPDNVPEELLDMSVGLADALKILARYKSTGVLQATVRRLSGRRREITCAIELLNGNVIACSMIQECQSMPTELAELLKVDEKQPSAWTFQAHPSEAKDTFSREYSTRQPESQLEIRASIVKTLRRLAVPIFSASNLKNI